MLKKPDNKTIMLTFIFLVGIALIFIPLIQQHQEIEDDNNIYTMLMEEIQRQEASIPVDEPATENESEDDPATADLPEETPEAVMHEDDDIPADEFLEETVIEEPVESDLPAMVIENITKPEETKEDEEPEASDIETIETESVINTVLPTKPAVPTSTNKPTEEPTKQSSAQPQWIGKTADARTRPIHVPDGAVQGRDDRQTRIDGCHRETERTRRKTSRCAQVDTKGTRHHIGRH